MGAPAAKLISVRLLCWDSSASSSAKVLFASVELLSALLSILEIAAETDLTSSNSCSLKEIK